MAHYVYSILINFFPTVGYDKMYIQQDQQPVYKLKYFTPTVDGEKKDVHINNAETEGSSSKMHGGKVKSFIEPGDATFANIRKRLSTLSLNSDYNKGLPEQYLAPVFRENRLPPRRISSISSRDTEKRNPDGRARINSRTSFMSDDKEFRYVTQSFGANKRASETLAVAKLGSNVLTPGQNPELFSRQIRLGNRDHGKRPTSRSTSPKSVRSVDSSGKVHLGLIESLDLNEKLKDVERIKERYSSGNFMNSLLLYKLRGHDRCFHPEFKSSEHIPRGTKLHNMSRCDSKMSLESSVSKRTSSDISLNYINVPNKWEPDKSHVYNYIQADPISPRSLSDKNSKRKKCVGFNMPASEELPEPPPTRDSSNSKTPRSILKRTHNQLGTRKGRGSPSTVGDADGSLANESPRWKFQLPKISSPMSSLKPRAPGAFKKNMYHFGDGISNEFEQVIARYGNCKQNSFVKERSMLRENSRLS